MNLVVSVTNKHLHITLTVIDEWRRLFPLRVLRRLCFVVLLFRVRVIQSDRVLVITGLLTGRGEVGVLQHIRHIKGVLLLQRTTEKDALAAVVVEFNEGMGAQLPALWGTGRKAVNKQGEKRSGAKQTGRKAVSGKTNREESGQWQNKQRGKRSVAKQTGRKAVSGKTNREESGQWQNKQGGKQSVAKQTGRKAVSGKTNREERGQWQNKQGGKRSVAKQTGRKAVSGKTNREEIGQWQNKQGGKRSVAKQTVRKAVSGKTNREESGQQNIFCSPKRTEIRCNSISKYNWDIIYIIKLKIWLKFQAVIISVVHNS